MNIFFYKKMLLKDLIKIEEQWLIFNNKNKFELSFNQYITLQKQIKEIGEITNYYFELMKDYDIFLKEENLPLDIHKQKLIEFNDKLLNSEISSDNFSLPKLDISQLQ